MEMNPPPSPTHVGTGEALVFIPLARVLSAVYASPYEESMLARRHLPDFESYTTAIQKAHPKPITPPPRNSPTLS
ncbi:hypothetical protein Hypma_008299 [Hypsizygus marmoreus]|uniref:Uncharacterized protein n=1 Tax=Hypsizygus marmoreus TaxID=39966 RepID=A0A369JRQ3_HYPMA|nr:hypothetical protein Hypma_008299 [Hypsizygus marmoreus]